MPRALATHTQTVQKHDMKEKEVADVILKQSGWNSAPWCQSVETVCVNALNTSNGSLVLLGNLSAHAVRLPAIRVRSWDHCRTRQRALDDSTYI